MPSVRPLGPRSARDHEPQVGTRPARPGQQHPPGSRPQRGPCTHEREAWCDANWVQFSQHPVPWPMGQQQGSLHPLPLEPSQAPGQGEGARQSEAQRAPGLRFPTRLLTGGHRVMVLKLLMTRGGGGRRISAAALNRNCQEGGGWPARVAPPLQDPHPPPRGNPPIGLHPPLEPPLRDPRPSAWQEGWLPSHLHL